MNPRIEAESARLLPRPMVAPAGHVDAGIVVASWRLPVLFSLTLFGSAALLFVVEPMFARMVLPRLGGSPAVWNTCVMFFQAAMLGGYAYAHLSTRWLTLWQQVALHAALVLTVAAVHRIGVPAGWMPPVDSTPIPALLMLLLVAIGAPFFTISATAPLLQKWFAQTNHPSARDPYFLYAASNVGSLLALLAYPFVIEPLWPLSAQGRGWSAGFAVVAILTVACAAAALRRADPHRPAEAAASHEPSTNDLATISWKSRARWLVLSFVPSSLMLGVTTFLSTDIGSVPLLWIAPLTLYLLSFVVTFSAKPLLSPRSALVSMAVLVPVLTLTIAIGVTNPWYVLVPLHLATFFAAALVVHGQLAHARPSTRYLTEFYLWISVGDFSAAWPTRCLRRSRSPTCSRPNRAVPGLRAASAPPVRPAASVPWCRTFCCHWRSPPPLSYS